MVINNLKFLFLNNELPKADEVYKKMLAQMSPMRTRNRLSAGMCSASDAKYEATREPPLLPLLFVDVLAPVGVGGDRSGSQLGVFKGESRGARVVHRGRP